MAGRRTKRTPQREKAILDGLRAGMTRVAAASRGEIHRETLDEWMDHFPTFSDAVTRAEAEAEARFTSTMAQAAAPHEVVETTTTQGPDGTVTKTVIRREFDWRAAESWLKRRRRADWGDNQEVTGTLAVGTMNLDSADETELRRRLADAAQALLPAGPESVRDARIEGDVVDEAD